MPDLLVADMAGHKSFSSSSASSSADRTEDVDLFERTSFGGAFRGADGVRDDFDAIRGSAVLRRFGRPDLCSTFSWHAMAESAMSSYEAVRSERARADAC